MTESLRQAVIECLRGHRKKNGDEIVTRGEHVFYFQGERRVVLVDYAGGVLAIDPFGDNEYIRGKDFDELMKEVENNGKYEG